MTVYVDVLFLINTLVNYFMLLGVKAITRAETKRCRMILASALGGVACISVLLDLGFLITVIKIFTAFLMVIIAFPFISFKVYFKKCIWLFLISIIFSGVCLAFYLLFDTDLMIYANGTVYFDVDITFLTLCTVISYIAITFIIRFTDKKIPKKQCYSITVICGDKTLTLNGFMDTGNNLKEPFSFAPVIVTTEKKYNELYSACNNPRERIIPVNTANGDGIMHAFRPDKIIFSKREIHNVYLGLGNSIPEGCDALLCPDLLGENYEKTKANT